MRDMLPCAVRFLGRVFDSVYWWVISSKNEGVARCVSVTLNFCLKFGCDYRGGRGCLVCQKQRIGWGVHYLLVDLCV